MQGQLAHLDTGRNRFQLLDFSSSCKISLQKNVHLDETTRSRAMANLPDIIEAADKCNATSSSSCPALQSAPEAALAIPCSRDRNVWYLARNAAQRCADQHA